MRRIEQDEKEKAIQTINKTLDSLNQINILVSEVRYFNYKSKEISIASLHS
jgi:hypothetical protein